MTTMAGGGADERLHGLDALRAGALLLGVVLHAAIAYLPWAEFFWMAPQPERSLVLSVLFWLIHLARMSVFFLLAGYFGRWLLERRGLQGFLRDRGLRIGAVLLLAWPLLHGALLGLTELALWMRFGEQGPPFPMPATRYTPDALPLGHLWFLWMLLLLYAGMLAVRGLLRLLDPRDRCERLREAVTRALTGPLAPLLLGAPLALAFWYQPTWYAWFGVPTPDHGLWPNRSAWVAYGLVFALGWGMRAQSALLLERLRRQWPWHVLVAGAAAVWALSILGPAPFLAPAAPIRPTALYACAYALGLVAATLGATGLMVWLCRRPRAWLRWTADAAYWVYLVHLPVVIALQIAAATWGEPWWVGFPAVLIGTLVICLGSYHLWVRDRALDRWLGRRTMRSNGSVPVHRA